MGPSCTLSYASQYEPCVGILYSMITTFLNVTLGAFSIFPLPQTPAPMSLDNDSGLRMLEAIAEGGHEGRSYDGSPTDLLEPPHGDLTAMEDDDSGDDLNVRTPPLNRITGGTRTPASVRESTQRSLIAQLAAEALAEKEAPSPAVAQEGRTSYADLHARKRQLREFSTYENQLRALKRGSLVGGTTSESDDVTEDDLKRMRTEPNDFWVEEKEIEEEIMGVVRGKFVADLPDLTSLDRLDLKATQNLSKARQARAAATTVSSVGSVSGSVNRKPLDTSGVGIEADVSVTHSFMHGNLYVTSCCSPFLTHSTTLYTIPPCMHTVLGCEEGPPS